MQKFIHTADNSNFKKEYVYQQASLFFLLYILKYRKGAFYAYDRYEQTNVIYDNKFSKSKTFNRIVASCNFYFHLNALDFMKNILCINF